MEAQRPKVANHLWPVLKGAEVGELEVERLHHSLLLRALGAVLIHPVRVHEDILHVDVHIVEVHLEVINGLLEAHQIGLLEQWAAEQLYHVNVCMPAHDVSWGRQPNEAFLDDLENGLHLVAHQWGKSH
jgi:hypothetical protein